MQNHLPASTAMTLEKLLAHVINPHLDQYVQHLAMTVVQLQTTDRLAKQQADLLKQQADFNQRTAKLVEDRAEITITKRRLTLAQKKLDQQHADLIQREQAIVWPRKRASR